MSINIEKLLTRLQNMFVQQPDNLCFDDNQTNRILEITSIIYAVKELHSSTIKEIGCFFENNFKVLNGIKVEGTLMEREIKRYRRKLHKLQKDIKDADYDVMKRTNELLDLMKIVEMYLADKKNGSKFLRRINPIDFCPIDNMGFSKRDGYSEDPSGKISFLFQVQVFSLIGSLLNLHKNITFSLFCQAEIIKILEPDPNKWKVSLIEYMSKMFPETLKRKKCFEIIKEELENEGINNYSKDYILKQLSNWNVYNPSDKEKNKKQKRTEPLYGYESARKGSETDFRAWVKTIYLPYYRTRKTTNSIASRGNESFDDENEEHNQQQTLDDFYDTIDENLK